MADASNSSGIPILGPILDLLTGIFDQAANIASLANSVGNVERAAWANTINLASWAFGEAGGILGSIGDLIKGIGKALGNLFGSVIWGVIKKLFDAIRKWIENLRNWIRVHVAVLQQIQQQLNAAWSKQMRQVLDIVQRIRKILVPFRLLHLGFATKLDATLAKYESDLGLKWAKLIKFNTQILGILNDVLDPRNLMRPGHVLGSLGMMVGAIAGAVGAADVRNLFCLGALTTTQPIVQPWSTTSALLLGDIQGNTGDYAIAAAQRDQYLQQYEQDLGVTLT